MAGRGKMRKRRTKEKKNKGKIEQRENITKEKGKVTVKATGSYKGRMIMYDVLVIGAGPAGSTAAKVLADRGLRVLLAEKCALPRYKSCSGILIKKSMDLVKLYFGEDAPLSVTCEPAENRGMIFTNDCGREYRFAQEGLNVWRSSFDNWLAEKAGESGAQVRDCTTVVACEEKEGFVEVTLQGKETFVEKAAYVLDCEGVVGAVRRRLRKETLECITTYQTFNEGTIDLDPHYFYAYLQPELSEYDAWFNVKDNLLVLGVSVKDPARIPLFYDRFLGYMRERHNLRINRQTKEEKWLMPHVRPGCRIDFGMGRVLFAGEAAGFLNPMGEGISAGMESGFLAANAVAAHFEDPRGVCDVYRESAAGLKSYMERQWDLVAGMAGTFREMAF